MNAQAKALVIIAAVIAFLIGAAINSARVGQVTELAPLLNAELVEPSFGDDQEPTSVIVKEVLGKLTLVNFWASWCAPCRQEMPLFDAMYRLHNPDGFNVVGIAIDNPENTQLMLDAMDITYTNLLAEKTGNLIMSEVGNSQGLLPYSVLIGENGELLDQVLGKVDEQQINTWLKTYL